MIKIILLLRAWYWEAKSFKYLALELTASDEGDRFAFNQVKIDARTRMMVAVSDFRHSRFEGLDNHR